MIQRFQSAAGVTLTPGAQNLRRATVGEASRFRNQRGLTHLSFEVDDIVAVEDRLLTLGGHRLPDARVKVERDPQDISLVFLTDPDGTRIELLQRHAASE